jgi:hypothetical protein
MNSLSDKPSHANRPGGRPAVARIMLRAVEGAWSALLLPTDIVDLIDPLDRRGVRIHRTVHARELRPGDRVRFHGCICKTEVVYGGS